MSLYSIFNWTPVTCCHPINLSPFVMCGFLFWYVLDSRLVRQVGLLISFTSRFVASCHGQYSGMRRNTGTDNRTTSDLAAGCSVTLACYTANVLGMHYRAAYRGYIGPHWRKYWISISPPVGSDWARLARVSIFAILTYYNVSIHGLILRLGYDCPFRYCVNFYYKKRTFQFQLNINKQRYYIHDHNIKTILH